MSVEQGACGLASSVDDQRIRRVDVDRRLQWMIVSALMVCGATLSPSATPQATSPVPPYCYKSNCSPTKSEAEAAMRADPVLQAQGEKLELVDTRVDPIAKTAQYIYRLKPSKPDVVYAPVYTNDFEPDAQNWWNPSNPQRFGCTPAPDDPSPQYAQWCAQVEPLYQLALQNFQTWLNDPECIAPTVNAVASQENTAAYPDHRFVFQNPSQIRRGVAAYGYRIQGAAFDCHPPQGSGGKTSTAKTWLVPKIESFVCPPLYKANADPELLIQEPTADAFVCVAQTQTDFVITGPFEQVDSECANPNPCHPATGDKSRAETDFLFAGRPFTRHYHSLRQLRGSVGFAEAWTHPYTDRVIRYLGDAVLHVMDEQGTYEAYTSSNGVHYVSQKSVNHRLDVVDAEGIGYRLRSPDGQVKEFDGNGHLVAVRDARVPEHDVTITRYRGRIVALTDARGRTALWSYHSSGLLAAIALPDQSVVRYQYDSDSNLTAVDYGNGQVKRYHYREPGLANAAQRHHLTGITDETGMRYASFGYDSRDRVVSSRVLGSPNDLTTLAYDSATQVTVNTASGGARVYTMAPDLYRRVLSVTESNGSEQRSYDAQGRLQSITDKRGVQTHYAYTSGYLSAVTEAVGTPQQRRSEMVRDPATHLITEQRIYDAANALKAKTTIAYNSRGQTTTTAVIDPATGASRSITAVYCEPADVTAGTCPLVGLLRSVDGPRTDVADTVSYQYRMADDPSCATAPVACAYRKGDLWKVTNALGHITEVVAYDGAGRVRSIKDSNGVMTDLEYAPRGWLTARKVRGTDNAVETDDRITRIAYTAHGLVERVTEPDGTFLVYGYDAGRRLTNLTDNIGNTINYTLNGAGQPLKEEVKDATGTLRRTLSRSYNTLSELQSVLQIHPDPSNPNPAATSFTYDAQGNPDLTTDALNRTTDQDYDPLGRLSRTLQDVGGVAADMRMQYDTLDRLTQVTDPKGLNTTYIYNVWDDLLQLTSPDTGTSTSTYDSAGNRKTTIDADGRVSQVAYDALNRPTAVTYPQQPALNVGYVYDSAQSDCLAAETFLTGRLAKMSDHSGSTTWCYDRFGQLTRKVQRTQGKTFTQRWSYQANGRLQSTTYPDSSVLDYLYDTLGRVLEIGVTVTGGSRQQVLRNASYYPFGPVAQWTYGNGRVMSRTLNLNGQPGIVQDTAAGGISLGYAFDAVGNLKTLRNSHQSHPPKRLYGYDGLNRVTTAHDAANVLQSSYVYDKTGNRTASGRWAETGSGPIWTTRNYGTLPSNHRVLTIGDYIERRYDATGNTVWIGPSATDIMPPPEDDPPGDPIASAAYNGTQQSAGGGEIPPVGIVTKTFVYNAANRMASVSLDGVLTMSYRYTGLGERVYRQGSSQGVHTVFGPAGQWIGDYDETGQMLQQAIWLGDLPVGLLARVNGQSKLFYLQPDALGAPRVAIDPVRDVAVWRWDLECEAFGNDAPNEDPDNDSVAFVLDMRYPGQQYDSATGFNYNYFRDYDPETGRYVQSDPIGLAGGSSTYGYVRGNPLSIIDRLGLCETCEIVKASIQNWWANSVDGFQSATFEDTAEKILYGLPPQIQGIANAGAIARSARIPSCPDTVTIYRGINSSHAKFADALKGIVRPNKPSWQFWRRGASMLEHNTVAGSTLSSPHTSWTTNIDVAINYALRGSGEGVLITVQVPRRIINSSPNLHSVSLIHKPGTVVSESEVLISRTIRGTVSTIKGP